MQNSAFVPNKNGNIFSAENKKNQIVREPILKGQRVVLGSPVKLDLLTSKRAAHLHQPQVEPIIENGQVIGFVFECACGESTEILFEYENA